MRLSISPAEVADAAVVARMQQEIVEGLSALQDVTSVAFASALPMESEFENNSPITAEGEPVTAGIPALRHSCHIGVPGEYLEQRRRLAARIDAGHISASEASHLSPAGGVSGSRVRPGGRFRIAAQSNDKFRAQVFARHRIEHRRWHAFRLEPRRDADVRARWRVVARE